MISKRIVMILPLICLISCLPSNHPRASLVSPSQGVIFHSITVEADKLNSTQQQTVTVNATSPEGIKAVNITWFTEPIDETMEKNFYPYRTFTDIRGEERSTWESRGRITVIDFWATWCGPCKRMMPELVLLFEQYHQWADFYSIGVTASETLQELETFASENGMIWNVGSDYAGGSQNYPWQVSGIPTLLIFRPNSTLALRHVGYYGNENTSLQATFDKLIPDVEPRNNTVALSAVNNSDTLYQVKIGPFPDKTRVWYYITAYDNNGECTLSTNQGQYYKFTIEDSKVTESSSFSTPATSPGFEYLIPIFSIGAVFFYRKRKYIEN